MARKPKPAGPGSSADTFAAAVLASLSDTSGQLPGDLQIRVDVHVCLVDAITDHFPITRPEVLPTTVPSADPIGADAQGWGICLATFASYIRTLRPIYGFYVHQPIYTQDTLSKPLSQIIAYLAKALVKQAKGLGE